MMISISKLKCFKSCRRAYELRYVEEIEPVVKSNALQTGSNYHEKLEDVYNTGYCDTSDMSKESAMAMAYMKYIYPEFKVKSVEDWFTYDLPDGDVLVGRTDGIAEDGCLVEHKSTGISIDESYEYNLMWDEQILTYMLVTGSRKVYYTVCRKPTIRQKQNETDEEFFNRMVEWYDDDTDNKIRLLEIERTDEDVEKFKNDLISTLNEIKSAEKNKSFYINTQHCNCWGRRCEYSSICLHYDKNQDYIEFKRKGE